MRTFTGWLKMPALLAASSDCVGHNIEGRVESGDFSLAFPRVDTDSSSLIAPEVRDPRWLSGFEFPAMGWGLAAGEHAVIGGLAIEIRISGVTEAASSDVAMTYLKDFILDFWDWMDRLSMFFELWSGQTAVAAYAARTGWPSFQLFDNASGSRFDIEQDDPEPSKGLASGINGLRIVAIANWRNAATLVSASDDAPSLPWRMFRRACQFGDSDPRYAVIEACSAAEIAVGQRIAETLFGHTEATKQQVIKNARGLIGLVKLADKTFGESTDMERVRNDLANNRNRAAHRGKRITNSERDDALATARWLLDRHAPLPQPE